MNPEYQTWIDAYLARVGDPRGTCKVACREMLVRFPELKRVPGHVYCTSGKHGHVWLETKSGDIIDPTASQFPEIFRYEPWKPGDEICVGFCISCGAEIWKPVTDLSEDNVDFQPCSEECFQKLKAEIERDGEIAVTERILRRAEGLVL